MEIPKIYEGEYRFYEILWEKEPVKSADLVKLCNERLGWKKSTTYTVIRRLCERQLIKLEDTVVTALYTKEQVQIAESVSVVEKTFAGSLPEFVAAFAKSRELDEDEIRELQSFIDNYKK
ncbi:MAG: BlaI/MecI/CopY family transcriptional regulator [Lachnospiraceae bacterium]|nr:BlaI/MecI/CopY family transcriptional regulator [Lachnospiraceae bacterium]